MSKTNSVLFILCLFLFVVKIIAIRITNFDLFGDEAQYWLWSQNLDFGYYSKPPLLSWIIALVCFIFGNSIFVIKMISVISYCLTSLVIFLISKKLINDSELAFLTAATFFLMPAVSFSSFLVSTDVVLIFFWSLSLLQLLKIKENPNKLNFILLGIFVGLAFLAKYAAIYFVFCVILMFLEKEMRHIFLKYKLYFFYFVLTVGLIIFPNLIWNIKNSWITIQHVVDNTALNRTSLNLINGLEFVVSQVIMIGPLVVIFFVLVVVKGLCINFNTRFLIIFSLPIFFIVLIESILVRANANWAAVSLVSFLILFVHSTFMVNKKILFINNILNLFFGIGFFFLVGISSSYKLFNRINGISSFADSLVEINNKHNNDTIVVSDRMLFSNLSYIFHDKYIKMYTPHSPHIKIAHHFQITNALPSNFNKNFIFIGHIDQLKYLSKVHGINPLDFKVVRFNKNPIKIYEVIF